MAVTVGSPTILHDAVIEVRRIFPGASVNEVLRMAALTALYGERNAREIVFRETEEIRVTNGRIGMVIPERERALIPNTSDFNLSETVRAGLAMLARADTYKEIVKRGRPKIAA